MAVVGLQYGSLEELWMLLFYLSSFQSTHFQSVERSGCPVSVRGTQVPRGFVPKSLAAELTASDCRLSTPFLTAFPLSDFYGPLSPQLSCI